MKLDLNKTNGSSPPLNDDPASAVSGSGNDIERHSEYLAVAKVQLQRGFKVVPVHPREKRGVLWNQYRNPATTLSEIHQHAKDFPKHNVGIVGIRGAGNHCFLDIDAEGVVERIERETEKNIPRTYTVQSSPNKKPWKRHYYFFQTEHSVATFRKNINRKDETQTEIGKKGTLVHPTLYDVKGIGGGAFVVAAGCSREDGERYTVLVDAPIVPIPDWLVDWIKSDYAKYWSEMSKQRQLRREQSTSMPDTVREVLKAQGDPSAFDVAEVDIYDFTLSRAGSLASLGVSRKLIEKCLVHLISTYCAGGTADIKEHRSTIHGIAFSKKLRIGNAKWFRRMGTKKREALRAGVAGSVQTRKSLLIEAMQTFPDRLTAKAGYQRLQRALVGTPFTLGTNKSSQKALAEVRKTTGFTTERTSEGWVWVRSRVREASASQGAYSHNLLLIPTLLHH